MTDQQPKPYTQDSAWLRIFFMMLFLFVYYVVQFVVFGVSIINAIFFLLTGKGSAPLLNFAHALGSYSKQVINFVTFVEEEKPFPFTDWPASK